MNSENSKIQQSFSSGKQGLITILSIISSIIFLGLNKVIPHFKTTFEIFGAEVPMLTKAIINLSQINNLLAFISLIPIIGILKSKRISFNLHNSIFKAAIVICAFAACYFIVSLIAMYLPIFELNNTKS